MSRGAPGRVVGYRVMSRPFGDGRVQLLLRLADRGPDLRVVVRR